MCSPIGCPGSSRGAEVPPLFFNTSESIRGKRNGKYRTAGAGGGPDRASQGGRRGPPCQPKRFSLGDSKNLARAPILRSPCGCSLLPSISDMESDTGQIYIGIGIIHGECIVLARKEKTAFLFKSHNKTETKTTRANISSGASR